MPKTKKLTAKAVSYPKSPLDLYKLHKGQGMTATQRLDYYAKNPIRYALDKQNLKTLLAKCKHTNTFHDNGLICINAANDGANAHLFASIFNRLSGFIGKGFIARQIKGKVYLEYEHYMAVLQKIYGEEDIPAYYSTEPTSDVEYFGEVKTEEQRKTYHDNNPARFRKSVNFLQNKFFGEIAAKCKIASPDKTQFYLQDAGFAVNVKKALNEFSYVVSQGNVATREDGVITIATRYYQEIENFVKAVRQYDHRKSTLTAADRSEYHAKTPLRKAADIRDIKKILGIFKEKGNRSVDTISFAYATDNLAKNAYNVTQRWSYLLGEGSIASKEKTKVSLSVEHFNKLYEYFITNAGQPSNASLLVANPNNPATQIPQTSNASNPSTAPSLTP